jgi:hypothetical protein
MGGGAVSGPGGEQKNAKEFDFNVTFLFLFCYCTYVSLEIVHDCVTYKYEYLNCAQGKYIQ